MTAGVLKVTVKAKLPGQCLSGMLRELYDKCPNLDDLADEIIVTRDQKKLFGGSGSGSSKIHDFCIVLSNTDEDEFKNILNCLKILIKTNQVSIITDQESIKFLLEDTEVFDANSDTSK